MARTAEEQSNLDLVLEMYNEVLVPFDSSKVDRYISPDYVQHSSLAPPGRDALKQFLDFIRKQSPDAATHIKRAFVDGDLRRVPCARDPSSGRSGPGGGGHLPRCRQT